MPTFLVKIRCKFNAHLGWDVDSDLLLQFRRTSVFFLCIFKYFFYKIYIFFLDIFSKTTYICLGNTWGRDIT